MSWSDLTREDYLRMIDRCWPFWAALDEFILANEIKSIVEAGCGLGQLCFRVDSYLGIDLNQKVITDNVLFYRRGRWMCDDFLTLDPARLPGELFVAAATIEHSESFQVFLHHAQKLPWRYAVVSFSTGLRDREEIKKHPAGFFNNCYARGDVERWLSRAAGLWRIYDLPCSRRPRQVKYESVLVIDRTGVCKRDMWKKRALNVTG